MQEIWSSFHSTRQSSRMQHEGQRRTVEILNGQPDWTMLGEGLQVQGLGNEESGHCQMKMPVERYQHAEECQALIYIYNGRRTLSKPRKIFTCTHSSLVSFSSCILSRFAELCSSQRSSSTKASTHCGKK
jgi:hypothetical protein